MQSLSTIKKPHKPNSSNVKIIYTVLNTKQFITLKKYLKEEDPDAFITVNESTEVLGKGFTDY